MTLLHRIVTEKRALVTAVALLLVVDCLLYLVAVYPWANKVSQAQAGTTRSEAQLAQIRDAYAIASQTNVSKSNADTELQRFYTGVLPRDLPGARSILSPYLDKLAADSDLVLERQTSVPEKERGSLLARLRTTMVLAGDYESIRQFIYAVETAPEFILIEEVSLSQGNESDEELVLTLGASTYYWAGSDDAAS